jgi:hypothetical protein
VVGRIVVVFRETRIPLAVPVVVDTSVVEAAAGVLLVQQDVPAIPKEPVAAVAAVLPTLEVLSME